MPKTSSGEELRGMSRSLVQEIFPPREIHRHLVELYADGVMKEQHAHDNACTVGPSAIRTNVFAALVKEKIFLKKNK
jgi:hypothetical protein